jgi:hypothetical protein
MINNILKCARITNIPNNIFHLCQPEAPFFNNSFAFFISNEPNMPDTATFMGVEYEVNSVKYSVDRLADTLEDHIKAGDVSACEEIAATIAILLANAFTTEHYSPIQLTKSL